MITAAIPQASTANSRLNLLSTPEMFDNLILLISSMCFCDFFSSFFPFFPNNLLAVIKNVYFSLCLCTLRKLFFFVFYSSVSLLNNFS